MQIRHKNMQIVKQIDQVRHALYIYDIYTDAYTMMSRTNAPNEDQTLNRNHKDIHDIIVWIN